LKNYYGLLSVARDAPPDEIKKAFRREIARYHPDKVQHLGPEFQQMAARMAADLTEAYRILTDPALRAKYDSELQVAPSSPVPPGSAGQKTADTPPHRRSSSADSGPTTDEHTFTASTSTSSSPTSAATSAATASLEVVRKVTLARLRAGLEAAMPDAEALIVKGFDLAVTTKPRKTLFKAAGEKIRLLIKFVPIVDAVAVADAWLPALRTAPDATVCLLLVGPRMSPPADLASAINEQRRKTRGAGPVLVPVDVRNWEALFPPDTPLSVRTLIRLLTDKR
jgi:curved DNA-binding protein CbpA